jgi:predicted nucleic-acid-binding Zn-ribbon protein
MVKVCSRCGIEKEFSEFWKRSASADGLMPCCKDCQRKYQKEHRNTPEGRKKHNEENAIWRASGGLEYLREYCKENRQKLTETQRAWNESHPEQVRAYKQKWEQKDRKENPTRKRDYSARRRKEDPQVRLKEALRSRLNVALKNNFKGGSAVKDLGCSIEEFEKHLESKFQPDMSWENYGMGRGYWTIDHVMPLSAFDLTNRQHVVLACHYLNLQPLWFEDNSSKGNKIDFEFQNPDRRARFS